MKHFGGKLSDASETFGLSVYKGDAIGYTYHTKNNLKYLWVYVLIISYFAHFVFRKT